MESKHKESIDIISNDSDNQETIETQIIKIFYGFLGFLPQVLYTAAYFGLSRFVLKIFFKKYSNFGWNYYNFINEK